MALIESESKKPFQLPLWEVLLQYFFTGRPLEWLRTASLAKSAKAVDRKSFARAVLGKPDGVIQPRVPQVGPEKFGIVAVDCAQARSKWLPADFYGNVLLPPAEAEHNRGSLALAVFVLRQAAQKHGLKDLIVCVEMTGIYHKPVQRAFRDAGMAALHTRVWQALLDDWEAKTGQIAGLERDLAGVLSQTPVRPVVVSPWNQRGERSRTCRRGTDRRLVGTD